MWICGSGMIGGRFATSWHIEETELLSPLLPHFCACRWWILSHYLPGRRTGQKKWPDTPIHTHFIKSEVTQFHSLCCRFQGNFDTYTCIYTVYLTMYIHTMYIYIYMCCIHMYTCTPTSCSIFLITNHTHQTEMAGESNEFASFFQFMYPGGRWRCHGQNDSCKCIQSIQGDMGESPIFPKFLHVKELSQIFFWVSIQVKPPSLQEAIPALKREARKATFRRASGWCCEARGSFQQSSRC